MASSPAPRRSVRVAIGVAFLALAGFWAYVALTRPTYTPKVRVKVRVTDAAGKPLRKAQVRTRYGGSWTEVESDGSVVLEDPRTKAIPGDTAAALADALEARAAFHAVRRGRVPTVSASGPGAWEAAIALEPCGQLRLGVAPSGFPGARATLDADGPEERWRLIEGYDVIRAGEAATYAVFEGAPALWVTLEGDRGVAQVRIELPAPGLGQLVERSLGPEPAQPIRGRIALPEGAWVPALHGVLEVQELREGASPIARPAVRIEPDGSFAVEYAGKGKFQLTARLPFATTGLPTGAAAGDDQVRIAAEPRPWIELGPADLARAQPALQVSLFGAGRDDLLPRGGAVALEHAIAVAAPEIGLYRVVVSSPGTEQAPPRSGDAEVLVPAEGSVKAEITLRDLPHGTVVVEADPVPEPGGEVRLVPDRAATLLPRLATRAEFRHLPPGRALLAASWRAAALADELLVAEVRPGETTRVRLAPVPGGRVRFSVAGTWAERERGLLVMRVKPDTTPYGPAEGLVPLARQGSVPLYVTRAALRPGRYSVVLHRAGEGLGPLLQAEFTIEAGVVKDARATIP